MITYYVSLIFLWYTVTLYYCWRLSDYLPCEFDIFVVYIHVTLYYCWRLGDYLLCQFDIFVVYSYIILLLETQWLLTMRVWYFCGIQLHYITAGDSMITYHASLIFLWYTVTLYYCWRLSDYLPCEFDIFVVYTRYIILLLETQWLLTMWVWYFCGIYVTLYYCWRLGDYLLCQFDIFVVYSYIILLLETQWLLTMWVWYFCGIYTRYIILLLETQWLLTMWVWYFCSI